MNKFVEWLENIRLCDVCGQEISDPMYMVNDITWKKAGFNETNHAHIECLESKLNRMLNYGDFTQYNDTPVNEYNPKVQERMKVFPRSWSNAKSGIKKRRSYD